MVLKQTELAAMGNLCLRTSEHAGLGKAVRQSPMSRSITSLDLRWIWVVAGLGKFNSLPAVGKKRLFTSIFFKHLAL